MAGISFDFASVATRASATGLAVAQAPTTYSAPSPATRSGERRSVFPSKAIISPGITTRTAYTQAQEARPKGIRRQHREPRPRVPWRGDAAGRLHKLPPPTLYGAAERRDSHAAVRAAEHRGDGDHNHTDQLVVSPECTARVLQEREMPGKGPVETGFTNGRFSARALSPRIIRFASDVAYKYMLRAQADCL